MMVDHDVALANFFAGLDSTLDRARRTRQADLNGFFADLGPVVDGARRAQAMLDRKVAPRFSVFDYFKERETDLSRAFGGLLDPTGAHGQGDMFLQLFLNEIPQLSKEFRAPEHQGCEVHIEYATHGGRKIDIVLEMPGGRWIGIENKPWADEQPDQIKDYMDDLQSRAEHADGGAAWILYLSGDGSDPTTADGLEDEDRKRCLTIPYRTRGGKPPSVENWIRKCWKECEPKRVRWFIEDFHEYIEKRFRLADVPGTQWGECRS